VDKTAMILRHKLSVGDHNVVWLSPNALLLSVGVKAGEDMISLWTLWRIGEEQVRRRVFKVVVTGWHFDDTGAKYIGTAVADGEYVWHVFEVT